MASKKQDELRPIIIKRVKKVAGGHHGGAWKVAYADFVTAMMAFFLLLWLLNVTTEDQKLGIADYFDPNPRISNSVSGAGGMLGGLSISKDGAMVTNTQSVAPNPARVTPALKPGAETPANDKDLTDEKFKEEFQKREEANFRKAEQAIKEAIEKSPELKELAKNLMIDMTPEGLRIQIVDQEGDPMFPKGSAQMYDKTKKLLEKVSAIIVKMPNEISVRGHTDSNPYSDGAAYTNWELSTDRANSSRRVLISAGFPEDRINNILGKADKDHMFPANPKDPRNRRISIILLREDIVVQQGANMSTKAAQAAERAAKDPLYRRSSGTVDFP